MLPPTSATSSIAWCLPLNLNPCLVTSFRFDFHFGCRALGTAYREAPLFPGDNECAPPYGVCVSIFALEGKGASHNLSGALNALGGVGRDSTTRRSWPSLGRTRSGVRLRSAAAQWSRAMVLTRCACLRFHSMWSKDSPCCTTQACKRPYAPRSLTYPHSHPSIATPNRDEPHWEIREGEFSVREGELSIRE
eukprot:3368834-Pyramimonas_sp.AAC.1